MQLNLQFSGAVHVVDDVEVKFKGASSYLYNSKTGNKPLVIHGNGPIKVSDLGL